MKMSEDRKIDAGDGVNKNDISDIQNPGTI